ncbi:MAG: DUF1501 domain-containing protein [Myxococcota bacterium]
MLHRRRFLQSGAALAAAVCVPGWPRLARGAGSDPVLVAVYLRGGADGLNLVVPADDPQYYALRPDIQVAPGDEIALDGFFGLNPQLGDLLPLYQDGELAFVHACGSTDGSRSHFDAQDFMERAAPGDPAVTDGWLNRTLAVQGVSDSWGGISFGAGTALALQGDNPSLAMTSITDFALIGSPLQRATLESLFTGADPQDLERAAGEGFAALDVIGAVAPGDAGLYPPGPYGAALADAAALVRADVGVKLVTVDLGGWDHHEGEVDELAGVGPSLAAGLAALRSDLGADWQRTTVLVMTEFGRTAAQNGSFGTDHGHGTVMLAAGGGVAGGQVITNGGWPGLGAGQLFEGRDLAVTTDFRDVFAEVLHRHLGVAVGAMAPILPGHDVQTGNFPGLFG